MNKHIALVKRYLAGEEVTTEELRANSVDADAAHAAAAEAAADAAHAADVAWAAEAAAAEAADVAAAATADNAHYWIKRYEELTNE
tara:strand:+ start:15 stop:272 length:258 start_codon:yes stop_codon:yes gene_type:complete